MPTTITRQPKTRRTPESTWAARRVQARRKVYAKPTVRIGPRDEEDVIEALCALNPYM